MIVTGWVIVCLCFSLIVTLGLGLFRWADLSSLLQKSLILLVGGQILLLLLMAYVGWPLSSFGLAQRNEVAEAFMSSLSSGDWETALTMVTDAPEGEYATITKDFSNPDNAPVKWELADPNPKNIVLGKAAFPDAAELNVVLFLEWEWEKARWGIYGVEFGRDIREGRIRFWLYDTFLPYHWFRGGAIIVSVACILGSMAMAWKINGSKKGKEAIHAKEYA